MEKKKDLIAALFGAFFVAGALACGGATVELETARTAACLAVEEGIEQANPQCTPETPDAEGCAEAFTRIDITRAVCDELKRRVRAGGEP